MRPLSGQPGNTNLWFRVGLISPSNKETAVLFDLVLPSEVCEEGVLLREGTEEERGGGQLLDDV